MSGPWEQYQQNDQTNGPWKQYSSAESKSTSTADSHITPDIAGDAWKAAVHAQMLGMNPGDAYTNRNEIDKQLRETGGDDYDKGIGYAAETAVEETPLGMLIRGQAPDPFESHNLLHNFVHDVTSMASDPVFLATAVAGSFLGGPEVGIPIAFALNAGLRKGLMDHYQKGNVKDFGELTDRAGDVLWAATKGGLTGEAMELAGGLPVGSIVGKSVVGSLAMKGAYQAAALSVTGQILERQVPTLENFVRTAAVVVPLGLVGGGSLLRSGDAKQALMDVYAEKGVDPSEQSDRLGAQPPVKPDLSPGLRASIKIGDDFLDGNENESHAEFAERVLAQKPVSIEELEADPKRADEVLQQPEVQEQGVLDKAWSMKKEDGDEAGPEPPQSGRGFVGPDGKFMSREQARTWSRENEPEVHQMWSDIAGSEKEELHSEAYAAARLRVENKNLAEGADQLSNVSPELAKFYSKARVELNSIKAGDKSSQYGNSVLRTTFVGPRNMLRAESEQVVSRMRKLLPDFHDQEALSFMRDYRDAPDELRSAIEEIRAGSNEKLKAYIPSMERALAPSDAMKQADGQLTQYFTKTLELGRQVGTLQSGIDPARYSPRLFARAVEEAQSTGGRSKLTTKTPNAIRREYFRLLDPLKGGEIEARTFNALDELSVYGDRHATSVATKLLVTELENSKLGVFGSMEEHPDGWVELNPGKRTLRDYYVPKVVEKAIAPMLRSGEPELAKMLSMQNYVKGLELGLSVFHMKALTITAMNNMRFAEFSQALRSDNASPQFESAERTAALYGLETTKTGIPVEAYKGLNASSLPTGLDKLLSVPGIKQIDAFAKGISKETFDVVQRKFKVMDFSMKQAGWMAKHADATEVEYGKAMRGIAKEVNAAYGGLNWDVLGVSKGMQNFSRLIMLAPDWTFSNVLNLKYSGEGGIAGASARAFWLKSFTTGFAMTAGMSQLLGGKYDTSHPEMVYLGKDDKGKDMYGNWFFSGAPKDAITLIKRVMKDGGIGGLAEFIIGKAGPGASTIFSTAFNKDAIGRPIYKNSDSFGEKTLKQGEFTAGKVVPITGKNVEETVQRMLSDPDHQYSYKDILEAIGDVAGISTVHQEDKTGGTEPSVISGKGRKKPYSALRKIKP